MKGSFSHKLQLITGGICLEVPILVFQSVPSKRNLRLKKKAKKYLGKHLEANGSSFGKQTEMIFSTNRQIVLTTVLREITMANGACYLTVNIIE